MRRLRVVVVGTTFGQFYLAALARMTDRFEVVGVLARGGERSRACAARAGVPLYTEIGSLPRDVDVACVVVRSGVMGGAGSELAATLLARGVHVVQEQPVHHDDVVANVRAARAHGVHYRVGDLYAHLPEVRRFLRAARVLLAEREARYVDAACSMQVAFPLAHLLDATFGRVRPWRLTAAGHDGQAPFATLVGAVAGVPLTLRVHNEVDPADPDNHIHLLHRITVGTDAGGLSLTDTHGPVLWNPRLHVPDPVKEAFDFDHDGSRHLGEPSAVVLGPPHPPSFRHTLSRTWPEAIGADLLALHEAVTAGAANADTQSVLTRCLLWQDITKATGYPILRPSRAHQPFPQDRLVAAAAEGDR